MAGRTSRNKGQSGEREFIQILQERVGELQVKFHRNLMQTADGGADVAMTLDGVDVLCPFAIEVKRQETLNIETWWRQTLSQTKKNQLPVLAYRQARKNWLVIILAHLDPDDDTATRVQLTQEDFLIWFERQLAKWYVQHTESMT